MHGSRHGCKLPPIPESLVLLECTLINKQIMAKDLRLFKFCATDAFRTSVLLYYLVKRMRNRQPARDRHHGRFRANLENHYEPH
jgi:hypothetical protein